MLSFNFLAFHIPFMDQSFVLLLFGLLIFGKRLPEVGRSLGQGIVQFKRGLKGIEEEVEQAVNTPATPPASARPALIQTQVDATTAHKFDPMTGEPLQQSPTIPPGSKFDPFTGKPIAPEQVPAGSESKDQGKWY